MAGTRIGSQGPIAERDQEGTSVEYHVSSSGFMPHKQAVVFAHVTGSNSSSLRVFPGVQTVSGNSAHTLTMPSVASSVGALFTVRSLSAHSHILSSSVGDTTPFMWYNAVGGAIVGNLLTLAAAVGASVTMISDGAHFMVISPSGSIT